jgi:hypothetical protein
MIIITTFPKTLTEEKKLILVRKDVDVNESLSNYTFRNKLKVKEQLFLLLFYITVGSSSHYLNVYRRNNAVCF